MMSHGLSLGQTCFHAPIIFLVQVIIGGKSEKPSAGCCHLVKPINTNRVLCACFSCAFVTKLFYKGLNSLKYRNAMIKIGKIIIHF